MEKESSKFRQIFHGKSKGWIFLEENISQFHGLNFTKGVPDSFRSCIQAALRGERYYEQNNHAYQGSERTIYKKYSGSSVASFSNLYVGSNLILSSVTSVSKVHNQLIYSKSVLIANENPMLTQHC